MSQLTTPIRLPRCEYPKSNDSSQHGLFELPDVLPSINWKVIKKYRSENLKTLTLEHLNNDQILEMAELVAEGFAKNEPMARHIQLPKEKPEGIIDCKHVDPFGEDFFGEWTMSNLTFWFIRLLILTNPSDPIDKITVNSQMRKISVVTIDEQSNIIGGMFSTFVPSEEEVPRKTDPFLNAVFSGNKPSYDLIFSQEHEAIEALRDKYPDFALAYDNNLVGLYFMVARSEQLPNEDTFELIVASTEKMKENGLKYGLACATNQWSGAAFEMLNATRVHFAPFRAEQNVVKQEDAKPTEPYSVDGYVSNKDSGALFYLIKLF